MSQTLSREERIAYRDKMIKIGQQDLYDNTMAKLYNEVFQWVYLSDSKASKASLESTLSDAINQDEKGIYSDFVKRVQKGSTMEASVQSTIDRASKKITNNCKKKFNLSSEDQKHIDQFKHNAEQYRASLEESMKDPASLAERLNNEAPKRFLHSLIGRPGDDDLQDFVNKHVEDVSSKLDISPKVGVFDLAPVVGAETELAKSVRLQLGSEDLLHVVGALKDPLAQITRLENGALGSLEEDYPEWGITEASSQQDVDQKLKELYVVRDGLVKDYKNLLTTNFTAERINAEVKNIVENRGAEKEKDTLSPFDQLSAALIENGSMERMTTRAGVNLKKFVDSDKWKKYEGVIEQGASYKDIASVLKVDKNTHCVFPSSLEKGAAKLEKRLQRKNNKRTFKGAATAARSMLRVSKSKSSLEKGSASDAKLNNASPSPKKRRRDSESKLDAPPKKKQSWVERVKAAGAKLKAPKRGV